MLGRSPPCGWRIVEGRKKCFLLAPKYRVISGDKAIKRVIWEDMDSDDGSISIVAVAAAVATSNGLKTTPFVVQELGVGAGGIV
jgi:hypothetical protein